ncbi:MAG TPA: hypothetical protein VJP02_32065 [Candidatus Sulfotelmatobacter sp.]|nr:hypothetical protein [Candidatus Sulfotelmatobacter sp.]
MVSQHITTRYPGTDPDTLFDLLDYLREQGFKITTDTYALVQDLLLVLVALGEDVKDKEVLTSYLAPVLCTNPREQANFPQYVDRWYSGSLAEKQQYDREIHKQLHRTVSSWQTWWWVIAVGALLSAAILWISLDKPRPAKLKSNPENAAEAVKSAAGAAAAGISEAPSHVLLHFALFVPITLLAYVAWWYVRGRLFLQRRASSEPPDLITVSLGSQLSQQLDQAFLRRTAGELRRRYLTPSEELAIEQTMERTIRNNGEFSPVYRSRLVAPEYLVLIDRKSFKDHNAHLVGEVIEQLQSMQVQIEKYYFDGDPRSLFPTPAQGSPISLRELLARNLDARILIFTDGEGLFDAVTGEMESWSEILWKRSPVAVFTARAKEAWGYREQVLNERAICLPATIDSVIAFAKSCNGMRLQEPHRVSSYALLPSELSERPARWLERDSPEPVLVTQVLHSVHRFLGDEGYFWLAACAAYPALNFNLTLYLGNELKDAAGQPLFSLPRAASLFRLPWMQEGYMPDWLRLRLLEELSPEQTQSIRQALNRVWISAAAGSSKAIDLEIARKYSHSVMIFGRQLFRRLRRSSPAESPLRDYVFASVMFGRSHTPLALQIPRFWHSLLRSRKERKPKPGETARPPKLLWKYRWLAIVPYVSPIIGFFAWIAGIDTSYKKIVSVVFVSFVIGPIAFPLMKSVRRRHQVLYHAYQALYLWLLPVLYIIFVILFIFALSKMGMASDSYLFLALGIYSMIPVCLLLVGLWLTAVVSALRGNTIRLPLWLGRLARRSADRWVIVPADTRVQQKVAEIELSAAA